MSQQQEVQWLRVAPFFILHFACLAVFWVGFSWVALAVAVVTYVLRAFGLTAFYHRYFAHRAFKTSRWFQFVGACLGVAAIQRGPIWWAAHHRGHHRHSDRPGDVHSPVVHGFWWSHCLWFMTDDNFRTREDAAPDLMKFPELRFVNRFDLILPVLLGVAMFWLGAALEYFAPQLGTNGWQMFVWAFVLSTVCLYHATFAINSLAHVYGSRRYETKDDSRNNFILAMLTLGEGWHNNHHHYPASARQGFYWWEIDLTYYTLVALSWFGIVWDIKGVPDRVLNPAPVPDPHTPHDGAVDGVAEEAVAVADGSVRGDNQLTGG